MIIFLSKIKLIGMMSISLRFASIAKTPMGRLEVNRGTHKRWDLIDSIPLDPIPLDPIPLDRGS